MPDDAGSILQDLIRALAAGVREELHNTRDDAGRVVMPRLLTVEQAAVYLGRSKASMQHLIAQRRIPIVREGRRIYLDVLEWDRWIAINTEPAA